MPDPSVINVDVTLPQAAVPRSISEHPVVSGVARIRMTKLGKTSNSVSSDIMMSQFVIYQHMRFHPPRLAFVY